MVGDKEFSVKEQGDVLRAFSKAVVNEAYNLTPHPDLLWQQLYNQLWWDHRVPRSVLNDALAKQDRTWLRRLSPMVESISLIRTLTGHGSRVIHMTDEEDSVKSSIHSLDVSPDGRLVMSGGSNGRLLVHEVATGLLLTSLQIRYSVKACAFDTTGRRIVLIDNGGLMVLDAQTYEQLWECRSSFFGSGLGICPNGYWIVTTVGRIARVWDTESGRMLAEFDGHEGEIKACTVTPDGQKVITGGSDGTIRVWDPRSATELAILRGHKYWVLGCALSTDGRLVVSCGSDRTVRVWDLENASLRVTLVGHVGGVNSCCVTHDGTTIVSGGQDGTVRFWDLRSGDLRATLRGHGGPVTTCAVTVDDEFAISGGADGTVRVWSAREESQGAGERQNSPSDSPVLWERGAAVAALSPNGRWMATEEASQLTIWDAASGVMHGDIKVRYKLNSCVISPDNTWMVTADSMRGLTTRAMPIGTELYRQELEAKDLAIAYQWMLKPRHPNPNYDVGTDINACALDPTGRWIASASDDGAIRLWTVSPLKVHVTLGTHDSVASDCAFSPDGSWIVSVGKDGLVRVWDAVQHCLLATLKGHEGPVPCCAVSPDGSFVLSGGADKSLRIWEIPSGELRASLKGHQGRVNGCAVGPNGRLIASIADDATMRVWDALTGMQIALLPVSGAAGWVLFDRSRPAIWSSGPFVNAVELLGYPVRPPAATGRSSTSWTD